MITAGELAELFASFPPDMQVIAGSDDEGNDFISPYPPSVQYCVTDSGYRCGFAPVHPDDVGTVYDESELVLKVVM